jgi:phosphoribosyl 1,2-cyclic phosphate phosphodiesterase
MKIEILGSGGAVTTPKPFCGCDVCTQARLGDAKHSRWGPCVFLHGPDILFDTPEEIFPQLNRSTIRGIEACFYSHWHPDHTAGKRVFEMNKDWVGFPPQNKTTKVVLTETVAKTFDVFLGLSGQFEYLRASGLIDLEVIPDSAPYAVGDYAVTPVQLGQDFVFGFDIAGGGKRVLVIMDELKLWNPPPRVLAAQYDLVYLPLGVVDVNPLTGVRSIDPNHSIFESEQTLAETLDYVNSLSSKAFLLGHVEEPDGIGFEMGERLGRHCSQVTGKNVALAFDTMLVEI